MANVELSNSTELEKWVRPNPCNDEVYEAVAKKLKIPKSRVMEIANAQSLFVNHIIQEGLFNGVRIPFLGKFIPKESKLYHVNRRKGLCQ